PQEAYTFCTLNAKPSSPCTLNAKPSSPCDLLEQTQETWYWCSYLSWVLHPARGFKLVELE
ncbi:hypothetical protein Anapl_09891, partial [Anas platyrhynchos]